MSTAPVGRPTGRGVQWDYGLVAEIAAEAVAAGRQPEEIIAVRLGCGTHTALAALGRARARGFDVPRLPKEFVQLLVCCSCGHREGLTGAAKLDDHCRAVHGRPSSPAERTPRFVEPS